VKPHRTDLISLTFGLVFLASATLWAVARVVNLGPPVVGWFVVAGLIVLGAVGITHAIVTVDRRRTVTPPQHRTEATLRPPDDDQPQ
jgi:hypothetical protein